MAVNRVEKSDGTPIIDISDSTVAPNFLMNGVTAYNAAGEKIVGQSVFGYLPLPTVAGEYTYTGSEQQVQFSGYSSEALVMTGTFAATNAGEYTVQFTPHSGYRWDDNTTETKSVTWEIQKAQGYAEANVDSVTVTTSNPSATVIVSRTGTGVITANLSNSYYATVVVSGTNVIITGYALGEVDVTISTAEDSNYTKPNDIIVHITSEVVQCKAFGLCTDAEMVSMIKAAELGLISIEDYWSVGDTRTSSLGTISKNTYYPETSANPSVLVRIEGFHHDTIAGTEDEKATVTLKYFDIKNWYYNGFSGSFERDLTAWSSSQAKSWLNSQVKAALPEIIKNELKTVTKQCCQSIPPTYTSSTRDVDCELFLESAYEIFGSSCVMTSNSESGCIKEGEQYSVYTISSNINPTNNTQWTRSPYKTYSPSPTSSKAIATITNDSKMGYESKTKACYFSFDICL